MKNFKKLVNFATSGKKIISTDGYFKIDEKKKKGRSLQNLYIRDHEMELRQTPAYFRTARKTELSAIKEH